STSADAEPAASADDGASDEKVGDKILAPAARKLVAEHDLDVSKIEGTGKGGRILKEDVQRAVKEGSASKSAKASGGGAA
ncbi:E3 binding domain-containing protein, partial [Klebsiella pneumoniae]